MAPKRRSTGETRMDAAYDAMTPYGFPKLLVRRTVQQLLKVYGGKDGWIFIEDSAYALLIETLLEKQDTPSLQDGLEESNSEAGTNEASLAGCSNPALLPSSNTEASDDATLTLPSSNTEASDDATLTYQTVGTVIASIGTDNQLPMKAVGTVSATSETCNEPPVEPHDISSPATEPASNKAEDTASASKENQVPIKAIDTASASKENQVPNKAIDNESDCQPAGNLALVENEIDGIMRAGAQSPQTESAQLEQELPPRKRRPCFGWISDDEIEEELTEPPITLACLNYDSE